MERHVPPRPAKRAPQPAGAGVVWKVGTAVALVVLAGAVARRSGAPADPGAAAVRRAPPAAPVTAAAPMPPPLVDAAPPPPPAPDSRSFSREGFLPPAPSSGEGSVSGQVFTPEGPASGMLVTVEWVAAVRPDAAEAAKLKRGGAHRDRDGVWWLKARATTDDGGFFSLDGLPAVPLRIRAGGRTQEARVGMSVQLRTGTP